MYKLVVMLHLLGASVWVGGHLILSLVVLPPALRSRDPAPIRAFEQRFEKIGLPALALQILTGLWLAHYWVPDLNRWLGLATPPDRCAPAAAGRAHRRGHAARGRFRHRGQRHPPRRPRLVKNLPQCKLAWRRRLET